MKPSKLHPALLGGLFIGVVSALPFVGAVNSCCCLWLVTGGVLAAYVMQQNHPLAITIVDGAAVGFLAGSIGVIVMALASMAVSAVYVGTYELGGGIGNIGDSGMSPEVAEMLKRMDRRVLAIVGGAIFVGVGVVASTVGGMIGAVLFRRPVSPPPAPPVSDWAPPPAGWTVPPAVPPPPPPPAPPGRDEPGSS